MERPTLGDVFAPADAEWFDEGERNAAEEWAELAQRPVLRASMPLALAFAGSAALGILLSMVI